MQKFADFGTRVCVSQRTSLMNKLNGGDVLSRLRGMAAFSAVVSMFVMAGPVSGQAAGQETAPSGSSAAAHSVANV